MNSQQVKVRVRRMSAADLERVLEIAVSLPEAPRWPVSAYVAAINPDNQPRRVALVVEEISDGLHSGAAREERSAGAKARVESVDSMPGINPWPTTRECVLGYAVASVLAPEAELETIAVSPQFQRRGLGALLLRSVVAELRKDQVREVLLEVRASNRAALGLYAAQGFEESGRRVAYYADPEEDAVQMRFKLP